MRTRTNLEDMPSGAQATRFAIADQVMSIRQARGMAAIAVARLCNVDRQTITRIENPNDEAPNLTTLMKVADALTCDLVVNLRPRDGLKVESALPPADTWGMVEFGKDDIWVGRVSDVSCFGVRMVQVDQPLADGTTRTVKRPGTMVTGFYPMPEDDARKWATMLVRGPDGKPALQIGLTADMSVGSFAEARERLLANG